MAGQNFEIQTSVDDAELPGSLRVTDTWDASKHAIEVIVIQYSIQSHHLKISLGVSRTHNVIYHPR